MYFSVKARSLTEKVIHRNFFGVNKTIILLYIWIYYIIIDKESMGFYRSLFYGRECHCLNMEENITLRWNII